MLLRIERIPTPGHLKEIYPLTDPHDLFVHNSRTQIRDILSGRDNRLLVIVGPCSIHDPKATLQYASKLKKLATEVRDTMYIVMRAHFEKPRTSTGWKGILHDPHLNGIPDLPKGLELTRKVLWELIDLEMATACELLDPSTPSYFSDLICWGCIGARTTTSQIHRQMASALHIPIGFKNSTDGNISHAISGVVAAGTPHSMLGIDDNGQLIARYTAGNKDCHIVLRGGEDCPNYDADAITHALKLLQKERLDARLLIDCSHDNSRRDPKEQITVFNSTLEQRLKGNHAIRGMIIESFLQEGHQEMGQALEYGISITDGCIGWTETETILQSTAEKVRIESQSRETTPSLCIVK